MDAPNEQQPTDAPVSRPSTPSAPSARSTAGLVVTAVLFVSFALASFHGVRRALTIGLLLDGVSAVLSLALFAWLAVDLRRRLARRRWGAPPLRSRWFTLRPALYAGVLLLPIAAWFALRIPGPMGEGPVAVAFDHAPWSRGPWHAGPVLAVSFGDSVAVGYGAAPGNGYFDLVVRNDRTRHPDVGDTDLSSVLPNLRALRLASLSTNSMDHERDLASLPTAPPDTFGLVFLSTGGIDLIHPYGHSEPKEGAMYGIPLAQARPYIERFEARLDRMLEGFASRFPAGCAIFVGTIYDPTDGVGDIHNAGVFGWLPRWPDALAIHAEFNRAIRDACARHPSAHVVDIHRVMLGHGIHCRDPSHPYHDPSDPTYWYYFNLEDPNDRGYDAIRRLFLSRLGEILPARFAALAPPALPGPR